MKDEEQYKEFLTNQYDKLLNSGINPSEVDIIKLTEFVVYLYDKQHSDEVEVLIMENDRTEKYDSSDTNHHALGATSNKKETNEGSNVSWENKKESIFEYEQNWTKEGKRVSQTTKEKHSYKDNKMEEKGRSIRVLPKHFLRSDIRNLYFPEQPLVTPELVDKIKKLID